MRLYLLVAVAACGSASSPAQPSTPPPSAAAPPTDPLRKYGYPTDVECAAIAAHMVAVAKADVRLTEELGPQFESGLAETCRTQWLLGKADCMRAAPTVDTLNACPPDEDPPEELDVSSAPGRPSRDTCTAEVAHIAVITPHLLEDFGATERFIDRCLIGWRPSHVACARVATNYETLIDCRLGIP